MGNILRTAEFFGVKGVILPTRNTCPLSSTVAFNSSGAVDNLSLYKATDIPIMLKEANSAGWMTLATGNGANVKDIGEIVNASDKIMLVLGNEGFGIRSRILKICQNSVRIEGGDTLVDSLNVSNACGILLYHISKTMRENRYSDF